MIHMIVSVRDSAMASYHRPFSVPTPAAAVRMFGDEVSRDGSEMQRHPSDYELWHLGHFDDDSGVITPLVPPAMLARAKDFIS